GRVTINVAPRPGPALEALADSLNLTCRPAVQVRPFVRANSPPRITARRGGRAIKKISRSIRFREGGVVFRSMGQGTPPQRHRPGGFAPFFCDAAPPPRGDARRGIRSFQNDTSQSNPNLDSCASKEVIKTRLGPQTKPSFRHAGWCHTRITTILNVPVP